MPVYNKRGKMADFAHLQQVADGSTAGQVKARQNRVVGGGAIASEESDFDGVHDILTQTAFGLPTGRLFSASFVASSLFFGNIA